MVQQGGAPGGIECAIVAGGHGQIGLLQRRFKFLLGGAVFLLIKKIHAVFVMQFFVVVNGSLLRHNRVNTGHQAGSQEKKSHKISHYTSLGRKTITGTTSQQKYLKRPLAKGKRLCCYQHSFKHEKVLKDRLWSTFKFTSGIYEYESIR